MWLWGLAPDALARVDIPAVGRELMADRAGDSTQRVQLYSNMAQQYSYLARHTGGQCLARQALQIAGRAADAARREPSPELQACVSLRQAVAHAQ